MTATLAQPTDQSSDSARTQHSAEKQQANAEVLNQAIDRTNITCDESGALVPKSLDQFWRLAKYVHASGLAPKSFKTVEQVFIAFSYGAELGLKPMMSLQALAVVNGKVTIWGDAQLALAHPVLEYFHEWFEDEKGRIDQAEAGWAQRFYAAAKNKTLISVAEGKRKDSPEIVREFFGILDAEAARLTAKDSPWQGYMSRMLRWRSRGWALRRLASDRFGGLISAEEAEGIDDSVPQREQPKQTQPAARSITDALKSRADNLARANGSSTHDAEPAPSREPGSDDGQ